MNASGWTTRWRLRIATKTRETTGGCLLWTGLLDRDGYARTWTRDSEQRVHRAVYVMEVGEIPDGHSLDHLCRNRACVNPFHLEPVTPALNKQRAEMRVGWAPACV